MKLPRVHLSRSRAPRRIVALTCALLGGACGGSPPSTGVAPAPMLRELTAEEQAQHLLNRAAFGPRPGDVAAVEQMGTDAWLERQLHPRDVRDDAFEAVLSNFPVWSESTAALVGLYPPQDIFIRNLRRARGLADNAPITLTADDSAALKALNDKANARYNQFLAAKVARAQLSERQLLEVMTDFWENHFSVFAGKMPTRFTLLEYDRDVIRPRALGRFRDLLGAVAHSPAMLYYLDNYVSVADTSRATIPEFKAAVRNGGLKPPIRRRGGGLNENYGRELLELHTLGVDGGYTQGDVINVARALTGWTIDTPREGGRFLFREATHDAEEKHVLGHALAQGRGQEDGEEVLDILARHPSTARFIASKLARRFVSDTPDVALVNRAAAAFTRTDGDIREVVRTILTSPEFYARAAYRAKVKSPYELIVSARRVLRASPDTTPRTAQTMARLGQPLFGKLTPDGWPETGDRWMNSGALLDRINLGMQIVQGALPGASVQQWPPWATLEITTLDRQVDGVIEFLLGGSVSRETRAVLTNGQNPLAKTTIARPTLKDLVGLALGAPEFQRR